MSDDHVRYREWAAAYVLGALEPQERAEFETHLSSCRECRDETAAFAPIPGLLARIDPAEAVEGPLPERVVAGAALEVADELHRLRRSRRLWQLTAAAAIVALLLVGGSLLSRDGGAPETEFAVSSDLGVTGEMTVVAVGSDSAVAVNLDGLPARDAYTLWAVRPDGTPVEVFT
ncbi:MAG TPA: zf-HC2 domain-containing protein, partial [Acidimicrobiales bacterium]|nr:zf-HC2 domain-containing protein [Acidimicrobiales bacterium]